MLRDLYPRHHHRYERSRCGAELEAFAGWLKEQGHLRNPLRGHLRRVRKALDQSDQVRCRGGYRLTVPLPVSRRLMSRPMFSSRAGRTIDDRFSTLSGILSAFLRYCGDNGESASDLDVIDTVRVYRGELPPRALDWNVVRRLLASIPRRCSRDWRNYTILHLMAYYGLRPSEVATLRLTSISWEAGTLRVEQRKTRSMLVLPPANQTQRLLRRFLIAAPCDLKF